MGLDRRLLKKRRAEREGNSPLVQELTDDFCHPDLRTWFTGTFASGGPNGPTEEAAWSAVSRFERRLGQMTHSPVPAVVVVESIEENQRTNVHALIGGVDHLPTKTIAEAWKSGGPCVKPARRYHAKYLAEKAAAGTAWERHPGNFPKAMRRVRVLEQQRKTTGPVVYDAGGRVITTT